MKCQNCMDCDPCKELQFIYQTDVGCSMIAPWRCECPKSSEQIVKPSIQLQMGWNGYGDYCDNGCCDYTDKHVRHTCKRSKSP